MAIKKSNAIIAVLVVAVLVLSATLLATNLSSNNNSKGNTTPDYIASIVDAMGRNVNISKVPQRIISCAPSITEIICSVGLENKLVGVTDYCNYPTDIVAKKANKTLPSIGGYSTPNAEAITVLNPDIVFLTAEVQAQKNMVPNLENMNVTVVVLGTEDSISSVYDNILTVGKACGMEAASTAVVDQMKSRISAISSKLSNVTDRKTIADIVWLDPIWVAGSNSYVQDMMNASKGTNVFSALTGFQTVSTEALMQADPDVILMGGSMMKGSAESLLSYLRNDSIWSTLTAVKTNSVYVVTDQAGNLFSRPGPRLVDGIELMADMLYPDSMGVSLPRGIDSNYSSYLNANYQYVDDNIPRSTIDGKGRTVLLSAQPTRIVSISATTTEMLYAFGMSSNIVGVNKEVPWPQDIVDRKNNGSVAIIGGAWSPNVEAILNLTPDLVILQSGVPYTTDFMNQLNTVGIPYLVQNEDTSVTAIYNNIQMLGDAVGKSQTAMRIIDEIGENIQSTMDKVKDVSTKSVAYVFYGMSTLYTVSNGSFLDSEMMFVNGNNVFHDIAGGWPSINVESLVSANPDVLILDGMGATLNYTSIIQTMKADPMYSQLKAVQNDKVYVVNGHGREALTYATVRICDGVRLMAMMIYPEAFDVILPNDIGNDYQNYASSSMSNY